MIVLYSTTNHTIVTAFSTIFKHGTPLGRLSVLPRYPGASSSTVTSEALMELAATLQPGTHGVPSGNFNALRLNMAIEIVDLPYEKLWKMVIFHSYVSLDIHRCGKLMGKPMGKMIYLYKWVGFPHLTVCLPEGKRCAVDFLDMCFHTVSSVMIQ